MSSSFVDSPEVSLSATEIGPSRDQPTGKKLWLQSSFMYLNVPNLDFSQPVAFNRKSRWLLTNYCCQRLLFASFLWTVEIQTNIKTLTPC